MDNVQSSATHSATLVRQRGIEHKDDSPELPLQVRPSQSERRPSAVENKYVKKILEFFERTAGRFKSWKKSWKESREETAMKRSANRAVSTITRGLATGDFKKVYQGLKRLHNSEQKLSNMDGKFGALDKDTYISDGLERVVSECLPDEKNSNDSEKATNLKKFAEEPDKYVDRHSDSKTLFHRMLLGLERFCLISSSYVGSRKQRIQTQDNDIKDSLQEMQSMNVRLLKKKIGDWFCGKQKVKAEQLLEKLFSGLFHDSVRIESFKELEGLAQEAYRENFLEESANKSYTCYTLYDNNNNCLLNLKQYKANKGDIDVEKVEKEIEENIDKQAKKAEEDNKEYSEKKTEFYVDYDRDRGQYRLNGMPLILEREKDIEQKFQKEGARVIRGICYQALPPILFFGHVCHDSTNNKEFSYHFTVDDDKKLLKIDYTYISNMAADLYGNKEAILRNFPEDPPLAKSIEVHACLNVEYDDAGRSSVKIDSFDCKYTKASEALI